MVRDLYGSLLLRILRRRSVLRFAFVVTVGIAGFWIPASGQSSGVLQAELREVKTISVDDGHYHAWPTLVRLGNGELRVVYSGGREGHIGPFGRVEMMVSRNQGETWSWPRTLFDSDIDDRDAGIVETRSGALLVTTFSSLSYLAALSGEKGERPIDDGKKSRWMAVHDRLEKGQHGSELGHWMMRSTDGGRSWSTPYRTLVNSPHGPIQLHDGRLLYPGRELFGDQKRVGVAESLDDGVSWRWLANIPFASTHNHSNYHEIHAVEASSGKIVLHIRYIGDSGPQQILQSESSDGGRSWSVPFPIDVFGFPSHLLRISDGRLLMTYGFRNKPTGVRARTSADDGKTWSEELVITSDGTSSDLGYPSTVELGKNMFLTVWYERMRASKVAVLRQAKWSIVNSGG